MSLTACCLAASASAAFLFRLDFRDRRLKADRGLYAKMSLSVSGVRLTGALEVTVASPTSALVVVTLVVAAAVWGCGLIGGATVVVGSRNSIDDVRDEPSAGGGGAILLKTDLHWN